ncbi:hypothetical protein CSE_00790 [Caldisericum exile AZM16c01]|uniref:Uncharacterized protein n=1 Tax=Caldisericum exile (strain DSM 21853 / NBRC 104410 / AZM16c01) TaxID=511051 RepID=A0A7U6GD41_CALEA|nr:hypothetical protein CSE_00790 [Caldisericum exile AZM16c01]
MKKLKKFYKNCGTFFGSFCIYIMREKIFEGNFLKVLT